MKCYTCLKEFEPTRADAKFCSANCRVTFSRNKVSVTDKSVTDNPVYSVTDKFNIVPKDDWRRDYLEEHAEFFLGRYEETKDCPTCSLIRKQFESEFMFCSKHLKFPKI
jgi:hypothetical protein